MSRRLTPQSTLDNLKREAKRWLGALRDNVAGARARLERALPGASANPTLRDIQHALAREHGIPGWSELKALLADGAPRAPSPHELVSRFLDNACPDHHVRGGPDHVRARHTAMRLFERYPEIAHASFYIDVVCGDLVAVERALAERPELASLKSQRADPARSQAGGSGDLVSRDLGPKGWEPLLYLCFTRLPLLSVTDNTVAIARALLGHNADPNVFFMAGDSRYTPLVGAIGEGEEDRPAHPQRDALVRLLLERGAEPYDIQVIYNMGFHGNVQWFLELIHERAVQLGRQADWDDPEWKMLDMGGYGSGARWFLGIAIGNHNVHLAEWCLEHGASPSAAPAPHPRFPKRSLYEEAVRDGCLDIAELLVRYGAERTEVVLDGIEAFATAAFRLDRDAMQTQLTGRPEYLDDPRPILSAAKRDRADVVALLLDVGVSPEVENKQKERPLHIAAYNNAVHVAELLIARGAAIDPVESNYANTPLGCATYYQHLEMIALLARHSHDIWEVTYSGKVERVRELLQEEPGRARVVVGGHTPLMWLPPQDEERALDIARQLVRNGADPALRNKDGMTAADRAERIGMFKVAAMLRGTASPPGDRPTLEGFERMANNLLDAYRTGTAEAMQRHRNETWHRRAWPAMRRYTLLDLGRVPGPNDEYIDISLDDARSIVAHEHMFGSWQALAEYVTHLPAGRRMIAARPVEIFLPGSDDADRQREITCDWDDAVELITARNLPGLDAHGQMTDEAMERISHLEHLTTLRLGGSKALTDAGVRHLSRMPQLRHLDLSGTQVTDRGVEALRDLPNLETISLSWTAITDAGTPHLTHCERLRRVDLGGTRTGDGTIRALAGKSGLAHFHGGAAVTDDGLWLLHQWPVFKRWQGDPASLELTSAEAEPNHLVLRGTFTDRGIAGLVGLDGLFGLNIDDSSLAITAACLAQLTALPHLGMLAFDAHDDAMPYIAALPKLRFLSCQDTDASDEGWEALSRSQSIESIWGRRCHNLRSRGFRALATMPALRALSVSCKNVADDALAVLPQFPALRELMPMDIPDEGYRHISSCEPLERLILMYCRNTTDSATEHITSLRHLKRYFASYTLITDRTPELLGGMPSLEDVEFSACAGLTDAGIGALAQVPRLRKLGWGGLPHVTREVIGMFRPDVNVKYSG